MRCENTNLVTRTMQIEILVALLIVNYSNVLKAR